MMANGCDDHNDKPDKPQPVFTKPEPVLKQHRGIKEADTYYALFVPDVSKSQDDLITVFTDKAECLSSLKRIQGARFKAFASLDEAQRFAEYGPMTLSYHATPDRDEKGLPLIGEKPSPFRGPKSQDLVKFRKAIEKGDISYFEECVATNPRYLISSGDTPSILQEGSRYNALHIACRNNQPYLCQRILSIVSEERFYFTLYPDDMVESAKRRSYYLLDLYLNTPDKALNETPLHFSCKHGSVGCVQILVSYPACDKNRTNKYNQTPGEVICSRMRSPDKKAAQKIRELLGDQYYVPVLRDEDNCLAPQIGVPWSPIKEDMSLSSVVNGSSIGLPVYASSPVSPSMKVRGYAGPMSPQKAESFYSRWKRCVVPSPSRKLQGILASIRLVDHEKGLERIGRNLACELDVDWQEYWDFLGSFINLTTEEGLKSLELHLQNQYKKAVEQLNVGSDASDSLLEGQRDTSEFDVTGGSSRLSQMSSTSIGEICRGLEALRLNMSLSPNPKTASSKEAVGRFQGTRISDLTCTFKSEETSCTALNLSESATATLYYNFVVQSVCIASEKLVTILREAAQFLELHMGPDFHVTHQLKIKLKREIANLRRVIVKHLENQCDEKLDLSFVHILLAVNTCKLLMEDVTADKIHLLSATVKTMLTNIKFFEGSSSSEEENICETVGERGYTEVMLQLECFMNKLQMSLGIANELVKRGEEGKINVSELGVCSCKWDPVGGGTKKLLNSENNNENWNTSASVSQKKDSSRFSRARSFLRRVLFGEKTEEENVVQQLCFADEKSQDQSASVKLHQVDDDDDGDCDSFVSAVSSVDEELMFTPEEAIRVFINGNEPSKTDMDVWVAIETVDIDCATYPYISMWQQLVASYSSEVRDSWASPCCGHRRPSIASKSSVLGGIATPTTQRIKHYDNLGQSPL